MSVPTTTAVIKKQDFTLTPIKVHKDCIVTDTNLETTASGYNLSEGLHSSLLTPVGAPKSFNDPKNELDGTFKHIIWNSIDHLYYRDPYNPFTTFEHHNKRYSYKFLNYSASLLSIPYNVHGEKIKPKSLIITNSDQGIELKDDGYGNIYDATRESILPSLSRNNNIAYWGFNSEFRNSKYLKSPNYSGIYNIDSYQMQSISEISQVEIQSGPSISGSESGISVGFTDKGYVRTSTHNLLNFDSIEDYTISFWIKPEQSGSIISKNGTIFQDKFGVQNKILDSGTSTKAKYISSSLHNELTDVYPYDFYYSGSLLTFKRSDGLNVMEMSASISSSVWNHVSLSGYESGSTRYCTLNVNGSEDIITSADPTKDPINQHDLMFGSRDISGLDQFSGSLDEIRFIDKSYYSGSHLDIEKLNKLYDYDNIYNTAIVGNIFYKRGNIVISSLNPKYQTVFSGSYRVDFKNTHTIYQYETLCRIKKGDFNLTQNPTGRRSLKSDQLLPDFTGSLVPYFSSIGLYNDKGELLAIAKMGQAIQTRDDVDLNVLIRFDG